MRFSSLTLVILLLSISCKTSNEVEPELGFNFFPLRVGAYQQYEVDETMFNSITGDIHSIYELRVTAVDSFANPEGGFSYILNLKTRKDASSPWMNLDTWTARTNSRQAIVAEGNTSYVKLTFPLNDGVEWNGNDFNTLGGDETCGQSGSIDCDTYRTESFNQSYEVSANLKFDQTVTIIQSNNPDLIVRQDVRKEVYAKGVGLIYKESIVLNYCTKGDCLGKQVVDSGINYKQAIKEYGGF